MATTHRTVALTALKILLALVLSSPVALLLLALDTRSSLPAQAQLDQADIARVERLLLDAAPANVQGSILQHLSLSNDELNLLLRYATGLLGPPVALNGRILLPGTTLRAEASLPVPVPLMQTWLNLSADFVSRGPQLELASLSLGRVGIPGTLVNGLARRLERAFLGGNQAYGELTELLASVQRIHITENRLDVDLILEPRLLARVRDQARQYLISDADQLRIARHYQNLASLVEGMPQSARAIPLSALFKPLFTAAMTAAEPDDPIAENRTLLLTLATYVNQEDIGHYLNDALAAQLPVVRDIEVRIQRRKDLAQHVTSTAAIAASAGVGLAQAIAGLKESYDARYRSGYSFSDLTANTAGLAIGRLATESEASARELQRRMSALVEDSDFLPRVESGADGLPESAFNAIYRDSSSDEYRARVREIESRVYELPMYDGLIEASESR